MSQSYFVYDNLYHEEANDKQDYLMVSEVTVLWSEVTVLWSEVMILWSEAMVLWSEITEEGQVVHKNIEKGLYQ